MEQQPDTPVVSEPIPATSQYQRTSGLAITSMVLGIVSVIIAIIWFIALPIGITAIILGIIALLKHRSGRGMSITGVVTGSVSLFVAAVIIFIAILSYTNGMLRVNEEQLSPQDIQSINRESLFE